MSFNYSLSTLVGNYRKFSFLLRFIDHGNGCLALRIQDPFIFDSGRYTCIVSTLAGDCSTDCVIDVEETNELLSEVMPNFIKPPLPSVVLHGNSATFCTRVTPVDSDVIWSVCGHEITNDMKDYVVSDLVSLETESLLVTCFAVRSGFDDKLRVIDFSRLKSE